MSTSAARVHETLSRTLLVDGLPLVFDPDQSRGSRLHDSRNQKTYLDFFGFFASMPLGFNHPRLTEAAFLEHIGRWAIHKPSNSDVYTVPFADFVSTFEEIALPEEMCHLFFIDGGGLAVENALKVAFDWKSRWNRSQGNSTLASRVIHLRDAFHGRTGYTMSLTNTDPTKTDLFPQFDWPRVPNPWCRFPLEGDNLVETEARETESLTAVRQVLEQDSASVAAILIEPIQCEGGDHHLRAEYVRGLRALADEFQVLLAFDEVQTGLGGTGAMWCFEHFGVTPDVVAFGKKTQVCGVMATRRIDEVPDNVFAMSSRINSTWGGNLVDMIRATRILEIYRDDDVLGNVRARGQELLAGAQALADRHPALISNPRGRGLFVAMDLPDGDTRQKLIQAAFDRELLVLGCGPASIRFRPCLDIDSESIASGLEILEECFKAVR